MLKRYSRLLDRRHLLGSTVLFTGIYTYRHLQKKITCDSEEKRYFGPERKTYFEPRESPLDKYFYVADIKKKVYNDLSNLLSYPDIWQIQSSNEEFLWRYSEYDTFLQFVYKNYNEIINAHSDTFYLDEDAVSDNCVVKYHKINMNMVGGILDNLLLLTKPVIKPTDDIAIFYIDINKNKKNEIQHLYKKSTVPYYPNADGVLYPELTVGPIVPSAIECIKNHTYNDIGIALVHKLPSDNDNVILGKIRTLRKYKTFEFMGYLLNMTWLTAYILGDNKKGGSMLEQNNYYQNRIDWNMSYGLLFNGTLHSNRRPYAKKIIDMLNDDYDIRQSFEYHVNHNHKVLRARPLIFPKSNWDFM